MENKGLINQEKINNNIEVYNFDINFSRKDEGEISYFKRGMGFLIGSLGLFVLEIIVGIFAILIFKDELTINAAATFICYGLLAIIFVFFYFSNCKKIFSQLLNFDVIFRGILFGLLVIAIPNIYTALINPLFPVGVNNNETLVREMVTIYPILSIIFAGLIGPLCEEFTYRISLFGLLRKEKVLAYIATALIFGIIHFDFSSFTNSSSLVVELVNLPNYIISGLILAYAYDRYGFGVAYIAHAINNVIAILFTIVG